MKNLSIQIRNKRFVNRLAALLCVSLLLPGCGKSEINSEDSGAGPDTGSYAEQVLEVGILANCLNPYAVVSYESFVQAAGQSFHVVVVELHDCRAGEDALLEGVEALTRTGVDVVLFDGSAAEMDSEKGREIETSLKTMGIPVVYFGMPEENADEYALAAAEGRFDAEGYREQAREAGKQLFEVVLSECGWE